MADADSAENRTSERATHLVRIYRPRHEIKCFVDLGCGTGTISKEIALHYGVSKAIGVDLHPPEVPGKIECLREAVEALPPVHAPEPAQPEPEVKKPPTPPPVEEERPTKPAPPPPPPPMGLGFDDDEDAPVGGASSSGTTFNGSVPSPPPNDRFAGMSPLASSPTVPQLPAKNSKTVTPTQQPRGASTYEYRQLSDDVIPCEDNSVDLITCFMAIHHFEHFHSMMQEVKRVLSRDGVLFIREHDVARDDLLLKSTLDNMHENYSDHTNSGVINYWPREELRKQMDALGFKHVKDEDYPPDQKNPQKIYHSLYAKTLTELKYVARSGKSAPSPAASNGGSGGAAGGLGFRAHAQQQQDSGGRFSSIGSRTSGGRAGGGGGMNGFGGGDRWGELQRK